MQTRPGYNGGEESRQSFASQNMCGGHLELALSPQLIYVVCLFHRIQFATLHFVHSFILLARLHGPFGLGGFFCFIWMMMIMLSPMTTWMVKQVIGIIHISDRDEEVPSRATKTTRLFINLTLRRLNVIELMLSSYFFFH